MDENLYAAEFANLGSQSASMESSKMVDMYGCLKNNHTEQADAEQAYIQADMRGCERRRHFHGSCSVHPKLRASANALKGKALLSMFCFLPFVGSSATTAKTLERVPFENCFRVYFYRERVRPCSATSVVAVSLILNIKPNSYAKNLTCEDC